jgi:hypothetical protein
VRPTEDVPRRRRGRQGRALQGRHGPPAWQPPCQILGLSLAAVRPPERREASHVPAHQPGARHPPLVSPRIPASAKWRCRIKSADNQVLQLNAAQQGQSLGLKGRSTGPLPELPWGCRLGLVHPGWWPAVGARANVFGCGPSHSWAGAGRVSGHAASVPTGQGGRSRPGVPATAAFVRLDSVGAFVKLWWPGAARASGMGEAPGPTGSQASRGCSVGLVEI